MRLIALAFMTWLAVPAAATTLTFDDLASSTDIGSYGGFDFANFYALDARIFVPSGYANGVVSRENIAYNGSGRDATITAAAPFSLTSAYLAAAWNDGLKVDVVGSLGGVVAFDQSFVVGTAGSQLETFDHARVDRVVFSSSGGTPHAGYTAGSGTQFAIDNLTLHSLIGESAPATVPEPSSWTMAVTGLAAAGAAMRRRRVLAVR